MFRHPFRFHVQKIKLMKRIRAAQSASVHSVLVSRRMHSEM
jgi:hypothetical protein